MGSEMCIRDRWGETFVCVRCRIRLPQVGLHLSELHGHGSVAEYRPEKLWGDDIGWLFEVDH